jgi:hypothetical protein
VESVLARNEEDLVKDIQSLQLILWGRSAECLSNKEMGGNRLTGSPRRWGTYTSPFCTCRTTVRSRGRFPDTPRVGALYDRYARARISLEPQITTRRKNRAYLGSLNDWESIAIVGQAEDAR